MGAPRKDERRFTQRSESRTMSPESCLFSRKRGASWSLARRIDRATAARLYALRRRTSNLHGNHFAMIEGPLFRPPSRSGISSI